MKNIIFLVNLCIHQIQDDDESFCTLFLSVCGVPFIYIPSYANQSTPCFSYPSKSTPTKLTWLKISRAMSSFTLLSTINVSLTIGSIKPISIIYSLSASNYSSLCNRNLVWSVGKRNLYPHLHVFCFYPKDPGIVCLGFMMINRP